MELTLQSNLCLSILLAIARLQVSLGFGHPEATGLRPEKPGKHHFQEISLQHLSPAYLSPYLEFSFLKITKSKFGRIDKNAFVELTHLNRLEISDSEIREQIDRQTFAGLPALEILVLENVGLRVADLNLTQVQDLTLAHNDMEVFDGRALIGRNLNFLDLSSNKLRSLEGSFANMSKLRVIDISQNKIEKVPPVFEENLNLLNILASENKLTSTEGLKLPWLRRLNLFGNKIESLSVESFPKMASLEELVLAFNNINRVEDAFKDLVELKHLNLAWNQIEELNSGLFRKNLYLTKLYLQGNKIKSLEALQEEFPHLIHLDLSHNQLTRLDVNFSRSASGLQFLDLSFNRLKTLDSVLFPLKELKVLNLAYNNLALTGRELSANRHLIRVNLSSNALQEGLTHFRGNPQLTYLDVSYNNIYRFCDGSAAPENLLKVNLKGNQIKSLACLKDLHSLCEVDLRNNPLTCGEELDNLIQIFATRKRSPYRLEPEFQLEESYNQCETLSLNRSIKLWNSVKRGICPEGRNLEIGEEEKSEELGIDEETEADDIDDGEGERRDRHKKSYVVLPLGWIGNDEMNKPNPLQTPQSGRLSWGNIEDNSEMKGFEDEEIDKRPRFSWYTIALILIGLSLTLTVFNLVVFLYIRVRIWRKSDAGSSQKYIFLHNEVYKNTTEPTKVYPGMEGEWTVENETKNKMFSKVGKINEVLFNFALNRKGKDSESVKNVLISPTINPQNH